nr:hypothetical protein [uncultured Pseudomonas sp.]
MSEFVMKAESIDVTTPNSIGNLDKILKSTPDWKDLDIADIKMIFKVYPEIGSLIIGLWSFDFLKSPAFIDESLIGYGSKRLEKNEQLDVVAGLLSIIRNCRVDSEEDEDAVDLHYSACGKLFRLVGSKAEEYLIDVLKKKPGTSVIEALGVLVGTEYQGRLKMSTVDFLKELEKSSSEVIRLSAKGVMINDVYRVNEYTNFLNFSEKPS